MVDNYLDEPPHEAQPPTDDAPAKKPYRAILKNEIASGLVELNRPTGSLFLSSLSAGLELGFSLLIMGVVLTLAGDGYGPLATRVLLANSYALGFILVIIGRSELFTEHTTLAVLPLLDRVATVGQVLRLWVIVFIGNILGAALMAWMIYLLGPAMRSIEPTTLVEIGGKLLDHPWWIILGSAVFAGWLMGELAWVIGASRDTISQLVFVWLITGAIGLAGLHHVVIGSAEVLAAVFASESLGFADFLRFLLLAATGNAIGGVLFVSIIKYGHASTSNEPPEPAERNPPVTPRAENDR